MKNQSCRCRQSLKHRAFAAFIGVLGIVGAPRENLWANDIAYRETIYNTDFASAGVGGMRNSQSATLTLKGVSGTVNKAYLYWAGPMNTTNPLAGATLRLNGQPVTGTNIGLSDDNCWGYDVSQSYRADITPQVRLERNGDYILSDFVHQGTNINANGASILVFFSDADTNNNRDIVLFEGNDSNAQNPYDALGWNVTLSGINYASGTASIHAHVSDGQVYPDDAVLLNGTVLEPSGWVFQGKSVPSANDGPMGYGSLWDIFTWDVTSMLTPGSNTLRLTHGYIGHDCVSLIVAAIDLPAGSAPPPPPPNHPPALTGTPLLTVNSPNPIVVTAQVMDEDGDPLTYRISVGNQQMQTGNIAAAVPATTGTLLLTNAFPLGDSTVVFTAQDGQASGSFTTTIHVVDDTPPVLSLPPNITVRADPGKNTASVTYVVTATDDFPGVVVISLPASGSEFPIGVTTVTATAVDSSGNRAQGTFTITVTDSTPPVVDCPPDMLQPTDPGSSNAIVRFTVSATDNLPGVTLNCQPPSGSVFPIGITTVVCLARDAAGNTATCMFTVTVVDRQPPVIAVPDSIVTSNDLHQCSAVVRYAATASDNAAGAGVVCTPPSGAAFAVGVTTVTCVATDASMNQATNRFTVTVQDAENPVLSLPANLTAPAEPGKTTAVVTFNVTATDNCSTAQVVCTPPSGSTFPLGTTTVTCTATDAAGNTATSSFNVTVIDTQPPVITVPNNITVPTDPGLYSAVVNFTVTIQDNQAGPTLVVMPPSGSAFPVGTTIVVAIGTDASGNKATNRFTVTVVDNEKPALQLPGNIVVTLPPGSSNAVVTYTVTATDNGPTVNVVTDPPSGSTFSLGVTVVTNVATDGAGNVSTGTFTVTLLAADPPVVVTSTNSTGLVLITPTNLIVATDANQCSAVVAYTVSLRDPAPGATVVCTPPSGSTFAMGVTPVFCLASGSSGQQASNSFTVTVVDREKPALQLPADFTVAVTAGQTGALVTYEATATDRCSAPATVSCTPPSGSLFPLGATTVTCTATDTSGNTSSGAFKVIVTATSTPGNNGRDTEPPVIQVPPDRTVANDPGQCSALVDYSVTVTDNQAGASVICVPPSGSIFPQGVTTVVCAASDAAGNKATNRFTITVVDQEKPLLQLPADLTVTIEPGRSNAVVTFNAIATDNCSTPTVVCTPPSGSLFPLGTTTVLCTAIDADTNAATGSFTVTVRRQDGDTQPPVVVSITPNKGLLWPPNHKMVPIRIAVQATDDSGLPVSCRIVSVTSNEPQNGLGDGNTDKDWKITGDLTLNLRAERSGTGSGRIYTVTVEAKDAAGNVTLATTTLLVPHDLSRQPSRAPHPKGKK